MSNLQELSCPFDAFKRGEPEALRYYFRLHNYRIYCYLLRLSRDRVLARELTQNAFIVLFRNTEVVSDTDQLIRRLYLHARVGFLLKSNGQVFPGNPEDALTGFTQGDTNIMEDPDIARNETLISLQAAMQKLPPANREVAELYFFQGFSLSAIARHLGMDEESVKEHISQSLKRLGDELSGNDGDKVDFSVIRASRSLFSLPV